MCCSTWKAPDWDLYCRNLFPRFPALKFIMWIGNNERCKYCKQLHASEGKGEGVKDYLPLPVPPPFLLFIWHFLNFHKLRRGNHKSSFESLTKIICTQQNTNTTTCSSLLSHLCYLLIFAIYVDVSMSKMYFQRSSTKRQKERSGSPILSKKVPGQLKIKCLKVNINPTSADRIESYGMQHR